MRRWDPDAGSNAALVVPTADLVVLSPPAVTAKDRKEGRDGPASLGKAQAITATDYDDSRQAEFDDDAYVEAVQKKRTAVVGKLGGRPVWIQADETPKCSCGRKMVFVAQIECRAGGGINFGDNGTGYAFTCARCKNGPSSCGSARNSAELYAADLVRKIWRSSRARRDEVDSP